MIFNFATDNLKPLIGHMKNQKTVFTNGCFDILHVGHARYLKEAAALGDLLIVGLNTDESVRNLKGFNRPIVPENERAEMLCHLEVVNAVVLFGDQTPLKLIEALNPQVLVKGGDWSVEDIVGSDIVLKNGGLVKSLSLIEGRSTTNIVDKILKSVE